METSLNVDLPWKRY